MSFRGSVMFVTVALSCQVLLIVIYVVIKAENLHGNVLVFLTEYFSFLPRSFLSFFFIFQLMVRIYLIQGSRSNVAMVLNQYKVCSLFV